MAKLETEHDAIKRKQSNAARMAKNRALETEHDVIKRKQCNAAGMGKKRKLGSKKQLPHSILK